MTGLVLLLPLWAANAFGISLDDFRREVLRPENLPPGRLGDASVETKITDAFEFGINLILYASGSVAVLLLIIGGIRYIASFGIQEQMEAAKKSIKFALIGLLVVILAYAIVTNIIDLVYRATI